MHTSLVGDGIREQSGVFSQERIIMEYNIHPIDFNKFENMITDVFILLQNVKIDFHWMR